MTKTPIEQTVEDTITIAEYTGNDIEGFNRFVSAAKMCGYELVRNGTALQSIKPVDEGWMSDEVYAFLDRRALTADGHATDLMYEFGLHLAARGYFPQPLEEIEGLDKALEEIRPLYDKSIQNIKTKNENFVGMNRDRPKKSACDLIFEAAAAYAKLTKG